jgi:hypothetical protein
MAFTLPSAPELTALNSQVGGTPIPGMEGGPTYDQQRAKLKTSGDVSAEEARLLGRQQQLEKEIGSAEQAGKQYLSEANASIATQMSGRAKEIEDKLQDARNQWAYQDFHPTKENTQSIATLFSLLGLVGVAMGGQGKMGAMNALNSMTGMMQGWQKGRQDLWNQEKAEFDKNMAKTKAALDAAYKDAEHAYKTLAYDKEEAQQLAAQSAAKLGGQVGKQILEKQGIEKYFKYLDGVKKDLKEAEKLSSQEHLLELRLEHQDKMQLERFQQQWALLERRLQKQNDKTTSDDRKQRKENIAMAQGLRGIENLQAQLRDPEVQAGLKAKAAPLLQQINSLSDKTDFETAVNSTLTGNDKTTLFLKDALLETYAIERAAKGGQRLTVQDMKMVGPVLDPTNYSRGTYNQLLEGRRRLLYDNLQDNGLSVAEIDQMKKPHAYTPYGGGAAPAASAGGVDAQAKAAFGSYDPSKYDYRINPETGKVQRKRKE